MYRLCVGIGMVAMLAAGCGDKKDDKTPAAKAPAPGADEQPAAPADKPAAAFDHDAYCAEVFGAADVNRILGVEGLASRPPRTKMPKGMADCNVEKTDANQIPVLSAKLMLDCRGLSMDVARHRELAKQLARDGEYRDVDVGQGGAYSKVTAGPMVIHTVTYVHATAPCSVTVSTAHLDENRVEKLTTDHVVGKITDANYPR